jgi:phenylalanyl-tRNA synthetase beta chain
MTALPESDHQYSIMSRYPAATRDLALVLPAHVSAAAVHAIIARHRLVERAELFDLYTGENVPAGTKSLAFRVYFQAPDRTLTNAEVDRALQGILGSLEREAQATLRS